MCGVSYHLMRFLQTHAISSEVSNDNGISFVPNQAQD